MKEIIFIADFFRDQLLGGAESNDNVLLEYLSQHYTMAKVPSTAATPSLIANNEWFIISNFIGLSEDSKKALANKKYIIYEHDHKYLNTRDPSVFPNFTAPNSHIINKKFYEKAHAVVVLSLIHIWRCRRAI